MASAAEQIGSQIRSAREDADISLRDLSQLVGISASTIGEYERGVKVPEADKLAKIARAVNHFTYRVDEYTFNIQTERPVEKPDANEQLRLDFLGEYSYATANVRIRPGRISVIFDGVRTRPVRVMPPKI
jgi:transcriptional regulator with XRE-family HTH domain